MASENSGVRSAHPGHAVNPEAETPPQQHPAVSNAHEPPVSVAEQIVQQTTAAPEEVEPVEHEVSTDVVLTGQVPVETPNRVTAMMAGAQGAPEPDPEAPLAPSDPHEVDGSV